MPFSRPAANSAGNGDGPDEIQDRARRLPGVILRWSPKRIAITVAATAGSAVFLLIATGLLAVSAAVWISYVFVIAGSVLTGLLAGSYVGAPIGAAATICDLRWPIAGLLGLVWADTYQDTQTPIQITVGVLALALMTWALRTRLDLERRALAPEPGAAELEACTDCRPLFPAKPQQRN